MFLLLCSGMVMPDDKNIAWTNTIGMGILVALLYAGSYVLASFSPSLLEIIVTCFALALLVLVYINYYNRNLYENVSCRLWTSRAIMSLLVALVGGLVMQATFNSSSPREAAVVTTSVNQPYIGNTPQCLKAISEGHWLETRCDMDAPNPKTMKVAYCQTSKWVWEADERCPISKLSTTKLRAVYKGKKILFAGDSEVRNVYHQFISILDPNYRQNVSAINKHSNIHYQAEYDRSLAVDFVWAPIVNNLTTTLHTSFRSNAGYNLIATGASAWDALYDRSVAKYSADLDALATEISANSAAKGDTKLIWLQPTVVITDRLTTEDKRKYMSEENIQRNRAAFLASKAAPLFDTVVDGTKASATKRSKPVDGLHYTDDVYEVIAHMVSNGYTAHLPILLTAPKAKYVPKPTGSMSFPGLGAGALLLAVVMLFTMDSFLGIGFLSLMLFGRSYDWEAGYGALHRKILGADSISTREPAAAAVGASEERDQENDALLDAKDNL